ncbi:hypothetical protein [Chamaesiphon sp.]|uniref:hypothetical protein n=1 Tax=Chamaesiphon sp. TaxID=2814140 RepID=UPI0035940772
MLTSTEIKNMLDAELPTIRVLLAESDPLEIDRIRSTINREFQVGMKVAKSYHELLASIERERPQLVILGKIDRSSYSEIAQECHKIQTSLPIVLLSSQGIIIDSFRQLVKTCGLTDVIGKNGSLNQLLQKLAETISEHSDLQPLGKTDLPTRQNLTSEPLGKPTGSVAQLIRQPAAKLLGQPISGKMMLAGLEEIVTISNNYFGPLAQGNYWRKTHARIVDEFPFIANWSADHFSKIDCQANILERELTDEDIQSLQVWVMMFVEECERIVVDYRTTLKNSNLSPSAKNLLATS